MTTLPKPKQTLPVPKAETKTVRLVVRRDGAATVTDTKATIPVPKEIPKIAGTYTTNYDIHRVHQQMLAVFEYWRAQVPQLQDQLKALQKRLATARMSPISETALRREIKQLEDTITAQSSDARRDEYVKVTEPWLLKYAELQQTSHTSLFGKKVKLSDAEQEIRLNIIAGYLYEANRFYRVDVVRDARKEFRCHCGRLETELPVDADGAYYCSCGYTREAEKYETDDTPPGAGGGTSSVSKDRENFIRTMANYQGKHAPPRYASIVAALDAYFGEIKYPTSTTVAALARDSQGRPIGTDQDLMRKTLGETGHAHGYPFLNYILHHYWGWPLPDISTLEHRLLEDYDLFQPVYEEIKDESGSIASLNVQYRLCRHLQRAGYPCRSTDFKIPQDASFRRLERQWNICHQKLFGTDAPPLR